MTTLLILPVLDRRLPQTTRELLGAAASLGAPVDALAIGPGASALVADLPLRRAFVADDPALAPADAERWLPTVVEVAARAAAEVVLFPHTLLSRELAPRLAFRLPAGLVADCVALRREGGALRLTKPVHGGGALAEYALEAAPAIATLRPGAFEPDDASGQPEIVMVEVGAPASRVRVVEEVRAAPSEGPTLKDARIVVAGGRGLGEPASWRFVADLADALGAAVGASRAVTDAGWVPPGLQVGLTGATVSPDLYVAVGISGAVQHMAGCAGARNLVAINRDPEANIFRHARWGVVGDFRAVLPALTARIRELRGGG